ncbi:MAG: GNAT family N-acetyltransferase [Saprospiraceae bacterium]|nr:GNAT family N-acetyltransferase [Saprospiraceae bacterium]
MKPIIAPLDRSLLEAELTPERFVRITNFGNNHIYILNHHNSPNVMLEIGRLREESFRMAGGGTGDEVDIDESDTSIVPYEQLIVWNPEDKEIVGGYRYIHCRDAIMPTGELNLSTAHLFNYSEKFIKDYAPYTIELGRSWVQPAYQPSSTNRKGLFSLDNLWDGLGALIGMFPDVKYFFGKVTMYPTYNVEARDWLMAFMKHYFPDPDRLVWPINPLKYQHDLDEMAQHFKGLSYKEGYRILNQHVRQLGENIPPLINSYLNLSPTMRTFGTAVNDLFGDVEETGIIITINDIYDSKKDRHVD